MPVETDYGGICLDTCMFEQQGFNLEKGYLAQLEQFANTPVRVLQCDIVYYEVEAHLAEKIKDARMKVEKAIKDSANTLRLSQEVIDRCKHDLTPGGTDLEEAQVRLSRFYLRTKTEYALSKNVKMEEVVGMYFKTKPPFEANAKKKAEFPDAIALKSIEHWAVTNKTKVLVVSDDGGWEEYCATSDNVDCVKDLKEALIRFQPHTNAARIAEELELHLEQGDKHSSPTLIAFTHLIEASVANLVVHAHVESTYRIQETDTTTEYQGHAYDGEVQVVRVSKDQLVLSVGVLVDVEIVAEYVFINRDSVAVNAMKLDDVKELKTDLLVTLAGDFSKGFSEAILSKVEMIATEIEVDFGEVKMDWESESRYDF